MLEGDGKGPSGRIPATRSGMDSRRGNPGRGDDFGGGPSHIDPLL